MLINEIKAERFTFLVSSFERQVLDAVARQQHVSRSRAMRHLLHAEAARLMSISENVPKENTK